VKQALTGMNGVKGSYAEPITGGKYLDINDHKEEIGKYGLKRGDVNMVIESLIGGMKLTTTIEGRTTI